MIPTPATTVSAAPRRCSGGRPQDGGGFEKLVEVQWGYDRASLKTWRKDLSAPASAGQDQHFGYDGLYQVTERQRGLLNTSATAIGGIPALQEGFGYDETGNWVSYRQANGGELEIDQTRVNNRSNQIAQVDGSSSGLSYDKNGNMLTVPTGEGLTGPSRKLVWDAFADWVQRRRQARGRQTLASVNNDVPTRGAALRWVEAVPQKSAPAVAHGGGLLWVHLSGGVHLELGDERDMPLAVAATERLQEPTKGSSDSDLSRLARLIVKAALRYPTIKDHARKQQIIRSIFAEIHVRDNTLVSFRFAPSLLARRDDSMDAAKATILLPEPVWIGQPPDILPEGHRRCINCGEAKPVAVFYRNLRLCDPCRKKEDHERYKWRQRTKGEAAT